MIINSLKRIEKKEAYKLLKTYYLDYGMTVITSRSLPDVRDGLKPVQRRILYAMYSYLNLLPDKPFKKCARIVGEVLGKLHPHGDSSVYGALIRLAQDFSLRYPLISQHGNFGKIDGGTPAAMRYTEAKLSNCGLMMMQDLNKNTVDFISNFDGDEKEPIISPSRIPNLLINGSVGMAVGFSTNIPTHNLTDSINQIIYQIDNPNCSIEELVNILKAPDFPTGGIITNPNDMINLYKNGEGKIITRGKYHIKNNSIIFTEIPFDVDIDTSKIFDSLKHCAFGYYKKKKDKKGKIINEFIKPIITNIKEVNDETNDIDGVNIEIVVDNKGNVNKVLKQIFDKTPLQSNFNALFNAVKGKKLLQKMNLKQINQEYINYQKEILLNRSKYELNNLLLKKEIIEGYCIILENVDKTVNLIKNSLNEKEAKQKIINEYKLTERQGSEITKLKLTKITHMGIEGYIEELKTINLKINRLKDIIENESSLVNLLKKELIEIRDKYGDKRKTEILYEDNLSNIKIDDVEDYNCNIILTEQNYIKKFLKQSDSHKLKDGDSIIQEFKCNNKDTLFFFTNTGCRIKLSVNDLELKKPNNLGEYILTLLSDILLKDEKIIKVIAVPQDAKGYIVNTYENGNISKTPIDNYINNFTRKKNMFNTTKCGELLDLKYITKDEDVLFINSEGRGLIINTSTVKGNGSPSSQGVSGMKLTKNIKCVYSKIGITQDNHIELTNTNNETKEYLLDDIAPYTTTDKQLYEHLSYNTRGIQGNFIWNTRNNNYDIKSANIK